MIAPPPGFAGHILGDEFFKLGEGPTYEPDTDTAWWFDILNRKLVEYRFGTATLTVNDLPMMASAMARIDGGRQMIFSEDGLCVRETKTGALSRYLDVESDRPDTRSNDARVHPCGAMWLSTMGKNAEQGAGAIYHVLKGGLTRLYDNVSIPNAICFSPDGSVGYFTDTSKGIVRRVALDASTGLPTGDAEDFLPKDAAAGVPDGAIVDADGNLWIARHSAGAIAVHAPDGGHLKTLQVPAKRVTCPAFIDKKCDRVLVTTSYEGLDADGRAADPLAGATFVLDEPVRGRFEPRLAL